MPNTDGTSTEVTVKADLHQTLVAVGGSNLPPCEVQLVPAENSVAPEDADVSPIYRRTVDAKTFVRSRGRNIASKIVTRHAEPCLLVLREGHCSEDPTDVGVDTDRHLDSPLRCDQRLSTPAESRRACAQRQ